MNKPLILVVEDDPSIRNLITTTLKTNDYRYVVAPNGSTAIMETTSHNPEIILLDLGLPDMDGVQVIQTVRSWSNTPIIVISARSEDNDKIHACHPCQDPLRAICARCEAGPVQEAEEAAAVQHLYPRSPHAAQDRILLCGGMGLDPQDSPAP